jgi:hypothetical protein
MGSDRQIQQDVDYDASLIDWFLSLSAAERLAELESRIAFFAQAQSADVDTELPANTRTA